MTLFDTAQGYAKLGYVCVPVNITLDSGGNKSVDTPSWRGGRVFDHPSDWEGYTGIAINTGASGVVAIDIDTGGGKDGFAGMAEAGVELPETPVKATSRSGGEHRIYRRGCTPVRSSSGVLAKDVDVRADGGMLFVQPTVVIDHPEQRYAWHPGTPSLPVAELPEFPEDLAHKLVLGQKRTAIASITFSSAQVTREQREWALRKIDLKLGDIAAAGPGQRNYWLGRSVPRIVGLIKTIGDDLEPYAEKIMAAYVESGGDDEDQVAGWINSSVRYVSPEDPNEWLPADRERSFWDARPELGQIKQAAYSRMTSPWAVLGATLVRVLADVPSSWRVDAGLGPGNLNLYTVLTGRSGSGKGEAIRTAAALWPSGVYETESASGEALPTLFAHPAKGDGGAWYTERLRDSAIIATPEFSATRESGTRQGSTLLPRLCNAFSAESLTFAKADPTKTVEVPRDSYRLGLIAGLQDGNAYMLLSEAMTTTGLAQRVVWMPAQDSCVPRPEDRPDWPGVLDQSAVRALPAAGGVVTACEQARRAVMEDRWRRSQPDEAVDALDGHKFYIRLKLACALAVLNGHRNSIRDDDWELSATIMEVSDATRRGMLDSMRDRDRKRQESAGKQDGIRKAVAAESAAEEAVNRAAGSIERWLLKRPTGGALNDLRKCLKSDKREHLEDAVELLVGEGRIVDRGNDWYISA